MGAQQNRTFLKPRWRAAAFGGALLALTAPATAQSLSDGLDDHINTVIEQATEDQVDDAVAERIEQDAEDQVQAQIEDDVGQGVEDNIEAEVEDSVTQAVAQSVEDRVEDGVGQNIEDGIGEDVEDDIAHSVEGAVENSVQGSVEDGVEESIEDGVGHGIENNLADDIEDDLEDGLSEQVREALEEDAAEDLHELAERAAPRLGPDADGADKDDETLEVPYKTLRANAAEHEEARRLPFREIEIEDGYRAVAGEWLLLAKDADMTRLRDAGLTVIENTALDKMGLNLLRVRLSEGDLDARSLAKAMADSGVEYMDRNHLYDLQADGKARRGGAKAAAKAKAVPASAPASSANGFVRIGMVDTALDQSHPALARALIAEKDFAPDGVKRPRGHGTAVASLIAGNDGEMKGYLPDARLYAASVFMETPDGKPQATAASLASALNWLADENVSVINISLAGPPNRILEVVSKALYDKGIVIVAAVGNAGPAAKPLYPAAYPHVLGITAVDQRRRVYNWAGRGAHVAFAAVGVDMRVARVDGGYAVESGTSLAAPLATATAAIMLAREHCGAGGIAAALAAEAIDLGPKGRDDIFGDGLLTPPSPRLALQE